MQSDVSLTSPAGHQDLYAHQSRYNMLSLPHPVEAQETNESSTPHRTSFESAPGGYVSPWMNPGSLASTGPLPGASFSQGFASAPTLPTSSQGPSPLYGAASGARHSTGNFMSTSPQVSRYPSQPGWDPRLSYSDEPPMDRDSLISPSSSRPSGDRVFHGQAGKSREQEGPPSQRRSSGRDVFDGPQQYLDRPSPEAAVTPEHELLSLPTSLFAREQDDVLTQVNDRLSQCAFDFVAKYQFPIPLESDKRPVREPADREWTEWVFLLKRLATKRRIPARLLYNGQIKQLITILENSQEMRHAAKHQSRPLKDDRNVLQLVSAGIQVAKILKDASAMEYLDQLYVKTEATIQSRRTN